MIKVGLAGEDPNDTLSIKNLLEKRYSKKVLFCQLAKRSMGYQLDNPKIKRSLPIEFASANCDFILYIRDLDALRSDKLKLKAKLDWFKDLDAAINKKGILLLNIWELEALILGDMATFNKLYKVSHKFKGDPMFEDKPKETLKNLTFKSQKQFKESHCPEIFKQLDIDLVEKNCSCFRDFIAQFNNKISL